MAQHKKNSVFEEVITPLTHPFAGQSKQLYLAISFIDCVLCFCRHFLIQNALPVLTG